MFVLLAKKFSEKKTIPLPLKLNGCSLNDYLHAHVVHLPLSLYIYITKHIITRTLKTFQFTRNVQIYLDFWTFNIVTKCYNLNGRPQGRVQGGGCAWRSCKCSHVKGEKEGLPGGLINKPLWGDNVVAVSYLARFRFYKATFPEFQTKQAVSYHKTTWKIGSNVNATNFPSYGRMSDINSFQFYKKLFSSRCSQSSPASMLPSFWLTSTDIWLGDAY